MDMPPVEFGADFLAWLRRTSEQAWQRIDEWSLEDFAAAGVTGARWCRGTRWTGGLPEAMVAQIERRYGLRFPAQYRLMLLTLHSTTPWQRGAAYPRADRLEMYEAPGFYDWLHEEPQIRAAMDTLVDGLLSNTLEGQYWHAS